jgi:hypothetical protein
MSMTSSCTRSISILLALASTAACVTPRRTDLHPSPSLANETPSLGALTVLGDDETVEPSVDGGAAGEVPPLSLEPPASASREPHVRDQQTGDGSSPAFGAINVILGDRSIDTLDPLLSELEDQEVFGLEGVILPYPRVPIGIELGGLYGSSEQSIPPAVIAGGVDVDLTILDSYVGLRLFLNRALPGGFPIEPFVSFGYAGVFADADVSSPMGEVSIGDGTSGLYYRLGLQVRLHQRVHVGADVRWLDGADATIDITGLPSAEIDLDHEQFSLFVGLRL